MQDRRIYYLQGRTYRGLPRFTHAGLYAAVTRGISMPMAEVINGVRTLCYREVLHQLNAWRL